MKKPVTRITDSYTNPAMQGASMPIMAVGSPTVLVGQLPVVQAGQLILPMPDMIVPGTSTVLHNGLPLQGIGDLTTSGGSLLTGATTVIIG